MVHTNYIVCHTSPNRRLFRPFLNCGVAFLIPSLSLWLIFCLCCLSMRRFCKYLVFLTQKNYFTFPIRSFTARLKPSSDKKSFHFQKKCCRWTPHRGLCSASIDKNLPQSTPHLTCLCSELHPIRSCSDLPVLPSVAVLCSWQKKNSHSKKLLHCSSVQWSSVTHPFFYSNLSLFIVNAAVNPHPGLGHVRRWLGRSTGCLSWTWAGMHPGAEQEGCRKERSTENRHPRMHSGNAAKIW